MTLEEQKEHFTNKMLMHGFTCVGVGNHSVVFKSKNDKTVTKFFTDDKYYLEYLNIINSNKDIDCFPRIKSYAALHNRWEGNHVIKMEALDFWHLGPAHYYEHWSWLQDLTLHYSGDMNYPLTKHLKRLIKYYPEIDKGCKLIGKQFATFDPAKCVLDFGYWNVLFRGVDNPVIIDPYYTRL